MSEDIVARLEQIENDIEYSDVAHVCGKAAETITKLRADLAAAEDALRLKADCLDRAENRVVELSADLAAAREALEPFAEAFITSKRSLGTQRDDNVYGVYIGDLRRAHALMKGGKDE